MHGIQHLFRQHAIDKQTSHDSWHTANPGYASYTNSRAGTNDSIGDLKPPIWNQGLLSFLFSFTPWTKVKLSTDRVLDQPHDPTFSSSPKSVPTSVKSPSQDFSSFGSSSSGRWKRSSPDPNKMMTGRSPNMMDANAKRILSTTPSRRASNQIERVGSPSLSGYPVRKFFRLGNFYIFQKFQKSVILKSVRISWQTEHFRAFVVDHSTVDCRPPTTASFLTISTTFTSTKLTINTSRTPEHIKITATKSSPSHPKRNETRYSGTPTIQAS